MISLLQQHRRIGRLAVRGPVRYWVSRRVWRELESEPAFQAAMAEGKADLAAGRFVRWTPPHE